MGIGGSESPHCASVFLTSSGLLGRTCTVCDPITTLTPRWPQLSVPNTVWLPGPDSSPTPGSSPLQATEPLSCPLGAISSSDPSNMGRELASPEPAIQVNELHSDLSSFWLQFLDSFPLRFLDPRSPGPGLSLLAPELPRFGKEVNQLKPEDACMGQSQPPEPRACFHTTPVLHHPPV